MADKRVGDPPVDPPVDPSGDSPRGDDQTKHTDGGLVGTSTGTLVAEITRQVLAALEQKKPSPQGELTSKSPFLHPQGCDQFNTGKTTGLLARKPNKKRQYRSSTQAVIGRSRALWPPCQGTVQLSATVPYACLARGKHSSADQQQQCLVSAMPGASTAVSIDGSSALCPPCQGQAQQ